MYQVLENGEKWPTLLHHVRDVARFGAFAHRMQQDRSVGLLVFIHNDQLDIRTSFDAAGVSIVRRPIDRRQAAASGHPKLGNQR